MMRAPEWIAWVVVGGAVTIGMLSGYALGRVHGAYIEVRNAMERERFLRSRVT